MEMPGMRFSSCSPSLRVGLSLPSLSCQKLAVRVLQFLRWTTLMHPRPLFTLPCLLQATLHLFVALSASWSTSAMATKGKSEVCVKKFPISALNFCHGSLRPSSSCSFTTCYHSTCRQPTCHITGSSSTFCCRSSPTSSAILAFIADVPGAPLL